MRYVGLKPARQSSAGSVTYVSGVPTTGLLRTCNTLRIASLPVLRNDGQGFALAPEHGAGTGEGGFETRPYEPRNPRPTPRL
ncbi:MAG: hypothetical protein LBM98_08500 [Oscillospiraceae bacterium]|nr:hypothetical protein [Oscillospiraceae bacterium]